MLRKMQTITKVVLGFSVVCALLVCQARGASGDLHIKPVQETPVPRPSGGPITVEATITSGSAIASAQLYYVVNYGSETPLPMTQDTSGTWSATIPASAAVPAAMVRWYIVATDANGASKREPPYANSTLQQYYGTVVQDTSFNSSLPIIEIYCKNPNAPYDTNVTATPQCSILWDGSFYDNIRIRRKGATSLSWPKPKFKLDAGDQGHIFKYSPDMGKVKKVDMNSEWAEPGENTFFRETLGWQAFHEMGVDYMPSYQTVVRMNGQYYGKYSTTVSWNSEALKLNGYATKPSSPNFKSLSGALSNLRWDIPPSQLQVAYKEDTEKLGSAGDPALLALVDGLSGGGNLTRVNYVFDWVNLPKVINLLAAQALVLNQDRCTKNFNIYLDPLNQQWSMLAWDLESTFGIDRGLGGLPAPDYCILSCEQWNSPLYCDHNHPQDHIITTPWGLITAQFSATPSPSNGGPAAAGRRRHLLLDDGATPGTPLNGAAAPNLNLPANSSIPADYDSDLTKKGPTVTGAPGTYNYLVDAIMNIPRTRAMYVRRLRTLMDQFITTGRLQTMVTEQYNAVRAEAKRDAAKWGNPGDVDRGYQQLITEQLPIRASQLFGNYSMDGNIPLIPNSQPPNASLAIGEIVEGSNGYVQVVNKNAYSVDISQWLLSGSGVVYTFVPGTVIPALDSVYVAANSIVAFRQQNGGQGRFVVGPLGSDVPAGGPAAFTITPAF